MRIIIAIVLLVCCYTSVAQVRVFRNNQWFEFRDSAGTRRATNAFEASMLKKDIVLKSSIDSLIKDLGKVDFAKGKAYFSGAGFPNVVVMQMTWRFIPTEDLIKRCTTGTILSFEECIVYRANGSKSSVIQRTFLIR